MPGVTSCAGTAVNTSAVNTIAMNTIALSRKAVRPTGAGCCFCAVLSRSTKRLATRAGGSALTLLVTQVLADHHDPAMTADHLALVADLLDAVMNLHLPAVLIGLFVSDPQLRADRVRVSWIGSGPLL